MRAVAIDNHDSPYAEALRSICRGVTTAGATPTTLGAADRLISDITATWREPAPQWDSSVNDALIDLWCARRSTLLDTPRIGGDLNDAIRGARSGSSARPGTAARLLSW